MPILVGSTGNLSSTHNSTLAKIRQDNIKIYNGDYEVEIHAFFDGSQSEIDAFYDSMKLMQQNTLEYNKEDIESGEITLEEIEELRLQDEERFIKEDIKTPADILWKGLNYGTLYWSWNEKSGIYDVYGISEEDGSEFIPRIWHYVPPEATIKDLENLKGMIYDEVDQLPQLKNGIPRQEFKDIISKDIDLLIDMLKQKGYKTLGDAAIPDAYENIEIIRLQEWNGNEKHVLFSTENYYFDFYVGTS